MDDSRIKDVSYVVLTKPFFLCSFGFTVAWLPSFKLHNFDDIQINKVSPNDRVLVKEGDMHLSRQIK